MNMLYPAVCRHLSPTNSKGARISVWYDGKVRVTLAWDHALNFEGNCDRAFFALATKLGFPAGIKVVRGETGPGERIYTPVSESECVIYCGK